MTLKRRLIRRIVGGRQAWPTGQDRIVRLVDAIKWRIASLPGLDADAGPEGRVTIFRRRK